MPGNRWLVRILEWGTEGMRRKEKHKKMDGWMEPGEFSLLGIVPGILRQSLPFGFNSFFIISPTIAAL